MKNFLFTLLALGTFSLLASAPAKAFTASETFKLYTNPNHQVSGCDVYTQLALDSADQLIQISERVGGLCALAIQPDTRVYAITGTSDVGGVRVTSASRAGTTGTDFVTIWDYRTAPPVGAAAPLIVVEDHNQKYWTLYSLP